MAEPAQPDRETREHLLSVLGEFVARAGAAPLLLPPVVPGEAAFPDPWAATRSGVTLLLRRLAWHAGLDRAIEVEDRAVGPAPTERKPATRVPLIEVRRSAAAFALELLGDDDVAGTLAHEIGVAFAVIYPSDVAPYRTPEAPTIIPDPDVDLERGSIATVYLGLGVLAANAALQHHTMLDRAGFHPLIVSKVSVQLEAGYLPVSSLTYLLAVQAALRGEPQPPDGLVAAQRSEVEAWLAVLDRAALRAQLGIAADATAGTRPTPTAFADAKLEPDAAPPPKIAFRWRTSRGGAGVFSGLLLGAVAAFIIASPFGALLVIGGALAGNQIGRRIHVPRCSACAAILKPPAERCTACGAIMRGDIAQLSDRLAAEEQLQLTEGRDVGPS